MTKVRPRHRWVPACLLGVLLVAGAVAAQTETPAGEQQPAAAQPDPRTLYRDIDCLQLIRQLQLTPAQVGAILPLVQKVADQVAADREADRAAYQQVAEPAKAVLGALVRGQDPPAAEAQAFDQAARAANERDGQRAVLAGQVAQAIGKLLTADQAAQVEGPADQARRQALSARLGGAATPLDYVMQQLDDQLELMPDEYLQTREQRALDMAHTLLGQEAPQADPLAETLLQIMDTVASYTPQQYARAQPKLRSKVAQVLGLPDEPPDRLLYDDFLAWISSDRTPVVLRELLAAQPAPGEVKP